MTPSPRASLPSVSTTATDPGSNSSNTCLVLPRKNLTQPSGRLCARAPFSGVAQRHLFEADAFVVGGPRNVQMAVDHACDPETVVPVGGQAGAAPHGELRVAQDSRVVTVQRIVVDG